MRTNKTEKKQKLKESKGISRKYKTNVINKNSVNGITLIALVITIIVLLILAGVAIATLTGENGILTQAGKAKDKTTEADAIERVQVEVLGSYGTDGKIDIENQLNKNLRNIDGLTYNGSALSDSNKITNLPVTVTLNGYDIVIDGNGSVKVPSEIEKAKNNQTPFGDNTTITDAYGNSITIPKGFKIASDSATDVTGGVVIEDSTYTNTKGSQFVWIPVGNIKYADGTTNITLGRYVFDDSSGNIDKTLSVTNPSDQLKTSSSSYSYYIEGLKDETTTNTHAKDIEAFVNSANSNHGYYIGRYEARKSSQENLTVVGTDSIYNNITQSNAATESRNMYDGTAPFTSDLMNSYAWDTAIVFEQAFDNRTTDKTKPYSAQKSLNRGLAETGTNGLTDTSKQDKICNIWDMASNCVEWTTETSSGQQINGHDAPCVARGDHQYWGGMAMKSRNTSEDSGDDIYISNDCLSFRPILYL